MQIKLTSFATIAMACCFAAHGGETNVFLGTSATPLVEPVAVEAQLQYAGEVTSEGQKESRPVSGTLKLDYAQQGLNNSGDRFVRRIDRIETGSGTEQVTESYRGLLLVDPSTAGASVVSARGHLTRKDLDQLQLIADPLDIDSLLPQREIDEAGTWDITPSALDRLLRLRTTEGTQVVGLVSDVTSTHVRIRLAGSVAGNADGATSRIELRGVGLFDRQQKRLTKLNLAWKESREVGPATAGVQSRGKINVSLRPLPATDQIIEPLLSEAVSASFDPRLAVSLRSNGWSLLADRDWYVVANDRHATTLRRVVGEQLTAVTTFVRGSGNPLSLEDFREEVRGSLAQGLVETFDATQCTTEHGLRQLTVASVGQLEQSPVEWRHQQLSTAGQTVAATSTFPADQGPVDEGPALRLVDSLRPTKAEASTASGARAALQR